MAAESAMIRGSAPVGWEAESASLFAQIFMKRGRMPPKTLFVDDEPDYERLIRQKYRKKLHEGLVHFEFAENGRTALQKIQEDEEIVLVMTDINMPEMDGLTLLREIDTLGRNLPVIIISAYGDMKNIRTAMNRGAFDFLVKPIDFEDMEITRLKAIRLQQEKRQLEERDRFIRDTFGRYLNDKVAQLLLDSPEALDLGGEKRQATILFSDLRGFCGMSERLQPEQIVATLNHFFGAMIDVIVEHGGVIDELIGDGILTFFGAPLLQEDHAQRAVTCAVAMQQKMESVNQHNSRHGLPRLEMGIGIDSGEVVVGNIGSTRYAKYGVVGKHVNLAARIESCSVGGQILVSEGTLGLCTAALDLGRQLEFNVKGFEQPVTVHELYGIGGNPELQLNRRPVVLILLTSVIPLRYCLLRQHAGKDIFAAGQMVKASIQGAEIDIPEPLELFSNIKIQLIARGGKTVLDEIYGKIISRSEEQDNRFGVRFTALPPEAERFLKELIQGEGVTI